MNSVGLNEMLINLYNHMTDVEKQVEQSEVFDDLSSNDMHIIEAIGINEPGSVSVIAKKLSVTVSTLTINMNGLEKKGYIKRERSEEDRRVVLVSLTESGKKAFFYYRGIQREKIKAVVAGLDEKEKRQLFKSLKKLNCSVEKLS